MCAKLLGFLLFVCQIIFNRSHVIHETTDDTINVTPTPAPTPSTLPEGYVRFPDLHSAYKVYTTDVTWVQARDQCIADGANLAIADSVEKIERMWAMQCGGTNWISVGIRKSNTTEDWIRIDNGLPLASLPWNKRQNSHPDWDCAGIEYGGTELVTMPCASSRFWFVCEIPIVPARVPVINSTPTPAPAPSTLPEGYVRFPDLHSAYKVYATDVTWVQARNRCIAEGAELAIADSLEKIERMWAIQSGVTNWISVGIRKSNTTEDWVRVDNGLPLASIPWNKRQNPHPDWDCAGIEYGGTALVTVPCASARFWYICEIPMVPARVPVINSTPTPAPAPSTLPEGYVRFPDLHAAYKVYKTSITWVRARDRCITEGADLAIADTVEKIERISAMQSEVDNWISVGIRRSNTTDDDWVRVDNGLSLTSIVWLEGSPHSHGDCAGISFGGVSLTNFYCTLMPCWYVCEIPI